MRHTGNFNLEWGYLAPAPSFLRSVRLVVVAGTIAATASAAVVFALVRRPAAEASVAANTLVQPVGAATMPTVAGAELQTQSGHASSPDVQYAPGATGREAHRPLPKRLPGVPPPVALPSRPQFRAPRSPRLWPKPQWWRRKYRQSAEQESARGGFGKGFDDRDFTGSCCVDAARSQTVTATARARWRTPWRRARYQSG